MHSRGASALARNYRDGRKTDVISISYAVQAIQARSLQQTERKLPLCRSKGVDHGELENDVEQKICRYCGRPH
jgi:hypothetical protein